MLEKQECEGASEMCLRWRMGIGCAVIAWIGGGMQRYMDGGKGDGGIKGREMKEKREEGMEGRRCGRKEGRRCGRKEERTVEG